MEETDSQTQLDSQQIAQETPAKDVFIPPSINARAIYSGESYPHHSPLPASIANDSSTPCVLGIDEAGRGPVIGPMVYGILYLPLTQHEPLLKTQYRFMDSKVLTPSTRSSLMQTLCTDNNLLFDTCGWAIRAISARDISAGMLQPAGRGTYNLNAQAMDATIELIKETFARGVNVQEIYIDTIGSPKVYQSKLERIFPTTKITVAKKADSLYPCVSAASVVAKVTRDAALEVCYKSYARADGEAAEGWGSGYPSDGKTIGWLKGNMDEVFGWGSECRFSWGTATGLLEEKRKGTGTKVEWPEEEEDGMKVTDLFSTSGHEDQKNELVNWFGKPAPEAMF